MNSYSLLMLGIIPLTQKTPPYALKLKAVIDEMDAQIREYSAMKLKAEIELGKRTAAIKPASGVRSDLSQSVGEVTKAQALAEMGVSNQRASDYERMAKHFHCTKNADINKQRRFEHGFMSTFSKFTVERKKNHEQGT